MEGITIRKMTYEDLKDVSAIETKGFTTPWTLTSFKYELEFGHSILKVAALEKKIIGYVCVRIIFDIANVLNLIVIPEFRQKGIGSMLLQSAIEELRRMKPDVKSLTLEVRESNIPAIRLYERAGFKIVSRRRGYYQLPNEDAIIMENKD
ncbi:MAG: ribosomal protein S18-alanine N-acetyltransferase [Nitrospirae bacterium]|nr:ribosomal protein S18-alanine N-acetyltransferase [Nitrospirota bacterium]